MTSPKNLDEFCKRFVEIKKQGWIKTHRSGATGIGKTLEDLLGIEENNNNNPDFENYELKAMRTNANSMLTLFTKTPSPAKINTTLLDMYGFTTENYSNNKKVLHATLFINRMTRLDGTGKSLTIKIENDSLKIVDNNNYSCAFWNKDDLEKAFKKKYLYRLVHVFADSRGGGIDEEFYFHTAWELYGFSFEQMMNLVREGIIAVDIRIGQYPDGRPHDHGTGFRIQQRYLSNLFLCKNVLVSEN